MYDWTTKKESANMKIDNKETKMNKIVGYCRDMSENRICKSLIIMKILGE